MKLRIVSALMNSRLKRNYLSLSNANTLHGWTHSVLQVLPLWQHSIILTMEEEPALHFDERRLRHPEDFWL